MNYVGLGICGVGALLTVAGAVAAVLARSDLVRLHYLSAVTVAPCPLVGLGLIVANGFTLTSATIALITVLLVATGPVLSAATGRFLAQRDSEC